MLLGEQSLHPDPQLYILYMSLFTLNHLTATSQNQATAHFFFSWKSLLWDLVMKSLGAESSSVWTQSY